MEFDKFRYYILLASLIFLVGAATGNIDYLILTSTTNHPLILSGDASTFTDVTVASERAMTGAGSPSYAAVTGNVYSYKLGVGDGLRFSIQMPHQVKEDSDIDMHLHVGPDGTDVNGGNAQFDCECAWADHGDAFTASVTLSGSDLAMGTGTANHLLYEFGHYTNGTHGVNDAASCVGLCSIIRVAATADEYAGDVWVYAIDAHVTFDKLGSRTELVW
jgi:hypothetical protein